MVAHSVESYSSSAYLPEVVVIVPIYNGEEDLPDLIDCIRAQTYPHELVEYLLVDNASCDRTAELIKAAEKDGADGVKIRYLAEHSIQSSYAARNAGIRSTSTDVLVFTDVDCRPQPSWLYEMVQPFKDPKIGLVGGAIEAFPGDTLLEAYAKRKEVLSHQVGHTYDPPFTPGANLAIRRQAFEEVGLFRPYLPTSGDIDICWRIMNSGSWQFYSAEAALTQHRHRKTLKGLRKQWRRYGRAYSYVQKLYDVDLFGSSKPKRLNKMWASWLVKEMPRTSLKLLLGKATLLDWLMKPIWLITQMEQKSGRKEAVVTDQTFQIEWL